jgi:hypothetical protein
MMQATSTAKGIGILAGRQAALLPSAGAAATMVRLRRA